MQKRQVQLFISVPFIYNVQYIFHLKVGILLIRSLVQKGWLCHCQSWHLLFTFPSLPSISICLIHHQYFTSILTFLISGMFWDSVAVWIILAYRNWGSIVKNWGAQCVSIWHGWSYSWGWRRGAFKGCRTGTGSVYYSVDIFTLAILVSLDQSLILYWSR